MGITTSYVVSAACIGYIFCLNCHAFRFQLARKSGYYSYLYCTAFGIGFLIVGNVLGFSLFDIHALYPASGNTQPASLVILLRHTAVGTYLAVVSLMIFNIRISEYSAIEAAWKDDLSEMLNRAIKLDLPVQITLDTRKVYVGVVYKTLEPDDESSYLSIIPLMSGYRDEETLEMIITNRYSKIFQRLSSIDAGNLMAYQFVIPKERIATSHIFDTELYSRTRSNKKTMTE